MHSRFRSQLQSLSMLAMLAICSISAKSLAAPSDDPAAEPSNIFSSPKQTEQSPRFVRKERPEMNRQLMGERDGIPGWQELKALPSLNAEQRKKIHDIFDESKKQSDPILSQLKELRQNFGFKPPLPPDPTGMDPGALAHQFAPNSEGMAIEYGRIARPSFGMQGLNQRPGNAPQFDAQIDFGAQRGAFRMGEQANPERAAKLRELQRELRKQREQSWQQVKALLSEQNLKDLDLMKRGELLPESLKADSKEPASSSLSKNAQPDFPQMMAPAQ